MFQCSACELLDMLQEMTCKQRQIIICKQRPQAGFQIPRTMAVGAAAAIVIFKTQVVGKISGGWPLAGNLYAGTCWLKSPLD